MAKGDNKLLVQAREALARRLPAGWRATLSRGREAGARVDARLTLRAPDGRQGVLVLELRPRLAPRDVVRHLAERPEPWPSAEQVVLVAPYLGRSVRERLREAGLGYLDLTGNIRITLSRPGLFIDAQGADTNPAPSPRPTRTLAGAKAGRLVRALVDHRTPPGVRALAELTGTNPGYVSRVMSFLDDEALIERRGRGRVVSVDWERLLRQWARVSPLSSRGTQTWCLAPRGLGALRARLAATDLGYAVTGTLAVEGLAPVAELRLAAIYVDDLDRALADLDLRPAERGANVLVIEPEDPGIYAGAVERNGLRAVAVSQAAADLLTSPGRGPEEAEALIAWMRDHEDVWRA